MTSQPAQTAPSLQAAAAGYPLGMVSGALRTYLNDHLGGAMLGSQLAEQIAGRAAGTELGEAMAKLASEIEQDRQTLLGLMERLDVDRNPVKEATAWAAEKLTRVKFTGATRGDGDFGLFMAVETMALGVAGKLALWTALLEVSSDVAELADTELEELIRRARVQHATLETQRLRLARSVLP